jgi:hypothetical protein
MAGRPRIPPDPRWIASYLAAVGIPGVTPERAAEELDQAAWGRLQGAWRTHLFRARRKAVPRLEATTWSRLEILRRRHNAADLDELVGILYRQSAPRRTD